MHPGSAVSFGHRAVRLGPPAVAAAVLAAAALLAVRDPNDAGSYPACPFKLATGLDCPGCGSLRAVHALVIGQPGRAMGHNLLLVLAVPLAVFHWVLWVRPQLAGTGFVARLARWRAHRHAGWWIALGVLAFAVARNLPWFPFRVLHS